MSILEELYHGNIPSEELFKVKTPEYQSIIQKIIDEQENWLKPLLGENYERFDKLDDMYSELSGIEQKSTFLYGFRFGALIMHEILTE